MPLIMITSIGQREKDEDNLFFAQLHKPLKPLQLQKVLLNIFAAQPHANQNGRDAVPTIDPQMSQKHPLRILLAEDNVINQRVALRILGRLGYKADVAANGAEALACLQHQAYDVVLMDVQMPEMDGITATQQIREAWSADRQPWIVAMTANALAGDREKYLNQGMNDYVAKPVRIEDLIQALYRIPTR